MEERGDDLAQRKKILVLESNKLLTAGIASMLSARAGFEVVNTPLSFLTCVDFFDSLQPDVVIMDDEIEAANVLAIIELTDRHPQLRVLVFRLRDAKVNVFDRRTVQMSKSDDLFELLEAQ